MKAGKTGSLRSLHYFMNEKKHDLAIRFNMDVPSIVNVSTEAIKGNAKFKLLSLPLYLVEEMHRLITALDI